MVTGPWGAEGSAFGLSWRGCAGAFERLDESELDENGDVCVVLEGLSCCRILWIAAERFWYLEFTRKWWS